MVQAAARRVLDFAAADLLDRRWWQRAWLLLEQLELDNLVAVRVLHHAQNAAALDYMAGDKVFDVHWEQCQAAVTDVWNTRFPWKVQGVTQGDDLLSQAWVNAYGDPDDPEVQERIRRTAEVMKEMREKALARVYRKPAVIRRPSVKEK